MRKACRDKAKTRRTKDHVVEDCRRLISSLVWMSFSVDSRWQWRTGVTGLPVCWTRLRCSGRAQPPVGGTRTQTCGRPDGFPPSCWGVRRVERGGMLPRRWWWTQTAALQHNEPFLICAMKHSRQFKLLTVSFFIYIHHTVCCWHWNCSLNCWLRQSQWHNAL